jgi:flagellar basal-body rod protein FlgF
MSSGIYTAAAGAVAQSHALDATANNIANATTAGFRGHRVLFREALANARSVDLAPMTSGTASIDSTPGALNQTDNPLDLALEGDGYFAVTTPDGARYTRAGNFRLDDNRTLVTSEGFAVRGRGGQPIAVPQEATQIDVAADGTVNADGQPIGTLEIVKLAAGSTKREGNTLYATTAPPVDDDGPLPRVRSGMLESSNVNVVRGVADLVRVSRSYESLMRVIQGYHDIESRAARDIGGPK